jgi:hypothetical protein
MCQTTGSCFHCSSLMQFLWATIATTRRIEEQAKEFCLHSPLTALTRIIAVQSLLFYSSYLFKSIQIQQRSPRILEAYVSPLQVHLSIPLNWKQSSNIPPPKASNKCANILPTITTKSFQALHRMNMLTKSSFKFKFQYQDSEMTWITIIAAFSFCHLFKTL